MHLFQGILEDLSRQIFLVLVVKPLYLADGLYHQTQIGYRRRELLF
jgi:hypothetical protein